MPGSAATSSSPRRSASSPPTAWMPPWRRSPATPASPSAPCIATSRPAWTCSWPPSSLGSRSSSTGPPRPWRWTIRGTGSSTTWRTCSRVQAGDRGFNDFLSRRFPGNAETEHIHDEMCRQIEDVLTRAQDAGEARPDITQADIVNLIWSNGRIIDATSATAPDGLAALPLPHARRLPGRAGTSDPRAADDGRAALRRHGPSQ